MLKFNVVLFDEKSNQINAKAQGRKEKLDLNLKICSAFAYLR